MAEIQISANKTVQMNSFVDAAATQRFTVKRRLYTESNWTLIGTYIGGTPSSAQTFNAINVPTVYEVTADSNWPKYGNEWKLSNTRVEYFNNPGETVIKILCDDTWGDDGDFNDLIVQFIVR